MSRKRYATLSAYKRDTRLTLQEMADLIGGVSESAVHLWVKRKRRPSADIALRIERRLGVPLRALLQPLGKKAA